MSDNSDSDDFDRVVMPPAYRRSIPSVGTAGILKGMGTGLTPADVPVRHAPASSVKSSGPVRAQRPASVTGQSETSEPEVSAKALLFSAKSSAAPPSSVPRSGAYPSPGQGYHHSRPGYRPSAAGAGGRAASQPKGVSRSIILDDSDDDDDDNDSRVAGPYSRGGGGAGPKSSTAIDAYDDAGATAEIAKQRLVDTHSAIIAEHRAAIERTADRLAKAVEEVDRFRSLEASLLQNRLTELDTECDAELDDLEAQFRAAQVQCRERYRVKAESERASSQRRVQERADTLMQQVEGSRSRVPPPGGKAMPLAAAAGAGVGPSQSGEERFAALRAKAASTSVRAAVSLGSDDDEDDA